MPVEASLRKTLQQFAKWRRSARLRFAAAHHLPANACTPLLRAAVALRARLSLRQLPACAFPELLLALPDMHVLSSDDRAAELHQQQPHARRTSRLQFSAPAASLRARLLPVWPGLQPRCAPSR